MMMTTNEPLNAAEAPWRLGHILDRFSETAPDSTALIVGEDRTRITYAGMADIVDAQSRLLTDAGLHAGDVIGLQSTNTIEYVVGLLAAARAGLVVAPIDGALPVADRQSRLEMAGARVTLVDGQQQSDGAYPTWTLESSAAAGATPSLRLTADAPARTISEPVAGLTASDALIMFTSGTTGKPKMVPWTHDNIGASIAGIVAAYGLGPDDGTVAVMPLFHGHGLVAALLATLTSGGRLLLPARGRFSAGTFWDDVAAVDATWYTAVPTIHQILLERAGADPARTDPARLRFIRSCSAPLSPATVEKIETTFKAPVLPAYGMTESTHQCSTARAVDDEPTRMNTVGIPSTLSVRIVGDDGTTCPVGVAGEIRFSGPSIVRGYLNNPAATAGTFVDGWLRTGDLGVVDERGALSVIGRIKEQINRGGEKISPERVENVLASHPDVAQAAVFGTPDALYGERVAAVVVTHGGSRPDLATYLRGRLASFEIPEHFFFAEELPLTAKGSVNRAEVAALFSP